MVEKRPGEELDDFSFKQPKCTEEPGDPRVSNLYTVDENASEGHDRLGNSSWVTSDENVRSESAAFHILLSPDEDHVSIIVHPRVIYYSLLDIPPQKPIPIGIDFQAELPESARDDDRVKFNKFEGTCVIPMPELELELGRNGSGKKLPGNGRTECVCEDIGSIRCVKQHVEESRVLLKMIIGTETFCKLGLDDMGEFVAEKWSEEENKMFHEVIYSNPESLGLNFWDQLVKVFPLRTKMEIVSYYFNVFMLRKRAEQNRYGNLSDIDSDNDELEASDEEKINEENDDRINSEVHENESFINQEIICDDMVDICYRGELNGPDVESDSCNLVDPDCRNDESNPDCQNGDSKDVNEDHEQQSDPDCQNDDLNPDCQNDDLDPDCRNDDLNPDCQNGDSKDVDEDHKQPDPDCQNGGSNPDCQNGDPNQDCQNGDSKDVDHKQPDPDCQNVDSNPDCQNGDSKDVDEHDYRAFEGNEGLILPQT